MGVPSGAGPEGVGEWRAGKEKGLSIVIRAWFSSDEQSSLAPEPAFLGAGALGAASVPPLPSIGMGQRQGSGHTGRGRKGRVRGGVWGQRLSCEKNVTNAGSQRRRGRESAPRSILRKRVGGWGAGRLQGFGGLRRRSRVRGGPGKVPAPLGPPPTRTPAGPDGGPPQLRLLVCGKGPPGSEAGALTPSRLGQLPLRRTPHGAAPHLALGTLGRTHQPSSGLGGRRARVRVPEDRRAGHTRTRGRWPGKDGDYLSRWRRLAPVLQDSAPPEIGAVRKTTSCTPRPPAPSNLTCSGAGELLALGPPSPRPAATWLTRCALHGSQLSRWRGGSRPGSVTPATPARTGLGARWRRRGCRDFPPRGSGPHTQRRPGGLRAPGQSCQAWAEGTGIWTPGRVTGRAGAPVAPRLESTSHCLCSPRPIQCHQLRCPVLGNGTGR